MVHSFRLWVTGHGLKYIQNALFVSESTVKSHLRSIYRKCDTLTKCKVDFEMLEETKEIKAVCLVKTTGKTGVEMEALTGVQIALLTIYDMCKAIDKHMVMSEIHLVEKTGGKSGDFVWKES